MYRSLIFSSVAGLIGTGIGGVIATLLKTNTETARNLNGFSAGIMFGLALLHLLPEASSVSAINAAIGSICGFLLFASIDRIWEKHQINKPRKNTGSVFENKVAALTFLAIALHNLPEGFAIGAGAETSVGIATALLIGLHNIPEGMSVALPIIKGKSNRSKAIICSVAAGIPTPVGGIIGAILAQKYICLIPLSLSAAAGAMLAVVIFEMFKEKCRTIPFSCGIIASILMTLI